MSTMNSDSIIQWRDYFRKANSDIFDVINGAITVAALDCPKEFRSRRDQIAELLFSSEVVSRCTGCDRVELENDVTVTVTGGDGGNKESKVNSCLGDNNGDMNVTSFISYGDAEALTDEIEEECQIFDEVLRNKEILLNNQDESDSVLFDCLRRLQLMALNMKTLQETGIGKVVNGIRRHKSQQIRQLAKTLVTGWKELVDEYMKASKGISVTERTPDSINPSDVYDEEVGLPSPPMDDGFFFSTQPPTGMELSQFFDGMDEDGSELKPNKPSNADMGPRRIVSKPNVEQKVNMKNEYAEKTDKLALKEKPLNGCYDQQDKLKGSNDDEVKMKLENSKRKLQERYQQLENAKKQRTTQFVELQDLPKQQGHGHKNQFVRPANNNRKLSSVRR